MPDLPPTRSDRTAAGSVAPGYFSRLYDDTEDPWQFATSPYEAAKYRATLAALPRRVYDAGLEIGCAEGVLTERLAARCTTLLAVDVAEAALDRARRRCGRLRNVTFERRALPDEMPTGPFDLVLLSEVAYYWSRPEWGRALDALQTALMPGGHLVLVHWTGPTDYPQSGDAVHALALADSRWAHVAGERHARYRLDVLERRERASLTSIQ